MRQIEETDTCERCGREMEWLLAMVHPRTGIRYWLCSQCIEEA